MLTVLLTGDDVAEHRATPEEVVGDRGRAEAMSASALVNQRSRAAKARSGGAAWVWCQVWS